VKAADADADETARLMGELQAEGQIIPSRRADQGHNCGAAEVHRIAENAEYSKAEVIDHEQSR
jgi:hypothetical protein